MIAAALLVGLSIWMLVPAPAAAAMARLGPAIGGKGVRTPRWLVAALALALAAVMLTPSQIGWLLIGAVSVGTVALLVRGSLTRRASAVRAQETAHAARLLSGLLRCGQLPLTALGEAADDSPALREAAMAARLGADVPGALRAAARTRGQEGLATVAAAWQVSGRTGAPIAEVLAGVAELLRRRRRLQSVIEAELAAARASGQIMAALPFLAIGLGVAVGVDSVAFLFGGGVGQVCLGAGVVLTAAGVLWIDRLASSPRTPQ